jgi:hypothetical protein
MELRDTFYVAGLPCDGKMMDKAKQYQFHDFYHSDWGLPA